jgi:hypothetical protein
VTGAGVGAHAISVGQIFIARLSHPCVQFVFSQVPNEYPFGVGDLLRGEAQMIDISDETTGLPHKEAREHLNMYVPFLLVVNKVVRTSFSLFPCYSTIFLIILLAFRRP